LAVQTRECQRVNNVMAQSDSPELTNQI